MMELFYPQKPSSPPTPSVIGSVWSTGWNLLDYLNRPLYAVAGAITAAQEGHFGWENIKRAWEGFSGQKDYTASDILDNLGMERGLLRSALSIPLDILLDPVSYVMPLSLSTTGLMGKTIGKLPGLSSGRAVINEKVMKPLSIRVASWMRKADKLPEGSLQRRIAQTFLDKGIEPKARSVRQAWLSRMFPEISSGMDLRDMAGVSPSLFPREITATTASVQRVRETLSKIPLPLMPTMTQQAAFGQRHLLSFGIPFSQHRFFDIRAPKAVELIGKAAGWARRTAPGKTLYALFNRTTGSLGLDHELYSPGGTASQRRYYADMLTERLEPVKSYLDDLLTGQPEAAVQSARDYINRKLEPLTSAQIAGLLKGQPARQHRARLREVVAAKIREAERLLAPELAEKKTQIDYVVDSLRAFYEKTFQIEAQAGLKYSRRFFYVPHELSDAMLAAYKENPMLLSEVSETIRKLVPEHGAMRVRMLTDMASIPVVNRMASEGEFGEVVRVLAQRGVKFLQDDPIGLALRRANKGLTAIEHKGLFKAIDTLADAKISLTEYARRYRGNPQFARSIDSGAKKLLTVLSTGEMVSFREASLLPNFAKTAKRIKLYVVEGELADAALRYRETFTKPAAMEAAVKGVLSVYDKAHSFLRKTTLSFPAWCSRNLVSNLMLMNYGGMNPIDIAGYMKKALQTHHAVWQGKYYLTTVGGVKKSAWSLVDTLKRYGGIERGLYAEVGLRQKLPWGMRHIFKLNSRIEDVCRTAITFYYRDKGLSWKDAVKESWRWLFDYSALSTFEKKTLGRLAFFYPWVKHNLAAQAYTYLMNPKKIVPLAVTLQEAMKLQSISSEDLPEWAAKSMPIPLEKSGDIVKAWFGVGWFPFSDLHELAGNWLKKLSGTITPLLKTPVELAMNYSLYRERPVVQWPGETTGVAGLRVPNRLAYLLESWRPTGTVMRYLGGQERSTLGAAGETVRLLTGVRTYRVDLTRTRARKVALEQKTIAYYKSMYRYFSRKGFSAPAAELKAAIEALGEKVPIESETP